ncbi:hypothetical protein CP960_01325 [Malaciobacter halophilus]|uniref:Uncharacterized protein n=1 Tax=Malaciobacter halophilus TaxID=197482 RepID=A0A2N1J675_9BACT|nr:hypothetical protein [Malaciobacter halophilus]AXH09556.1 hypothetical protein AHALO_1179 [Malaciobacter halophilus]PKI81982.1 hypothetical protein CP960_01325 [Malaciobacter halophilus]
MDDIIDLEPKITLMFSAYHGKETFTFTKDEILQIATMPPKNRNFEYKLSLQNNSFFAIRDMNEFQYYYKSGSGTRSSTAIYYFPNIAKKIFKVINDLDFWEEDEDFPIILITEQDYMPNEPI